MRVLPCFGVEVGSYGEVAGVFFSCLGYDVSFYGDDGNLIGGIDESVTEWIDCDIGSAYEYTLFGAWSVDGDDVSSGGNRKCLEDNPPTVDGCDFCCARVDDCFCALCCECECALWSVDVGADLYAEANVELIIDLGDIFALRVVVCFPEAGFFGDVAFAE